MYVLDILGSPGHVGEVPANAVLGRLGFARRAARVHEEENPLRGHDHRVHALAAEITQQIVDEEVAPVYHWRFRRVLPRRLLQTSTLSTFCPASSATLSATSAFDLWSRS